MEETILKLEKINMYFPGVHALKDMDFELKRGEVHALLGENGAGKSTLMKVLTGVLKPDSGLIVYEGKKYEFLNIVQAQKLGISMIYQELNQVPYLSAAENIFLGREPKKGKLIDFKKMNSDAEEIFKLLGVKINPREKVKSLSVAYRQIVEVAKAVSKKVKVLIMDEPTAPLTNDEVELLFKLVRKLKSEGVSIIYISHRMEEIFKLCDSFTVFRDGTYIDTMKIGDTNKNDLIKMMVGRDITNQYPEKIQVLDTGINKLEVKSLVSDKLDSISLELKKGEILGVGGLVGSGRTELLRAIFGADKLSSGEIIKDGRILKIENPWDAIKHGIVLLPEDRKQQGLLLKMTVKDNMILPIINTMKKGLFINNSKIEEVVNNLIDSLRIKTPSNLQITKNLSGGNQQKIVVAKWILSNADIVMFDEPTRGIDVGAKYEIYCLMNQLKSEGKSIIMVSSEMPELIGMSDRICVMCDGRISGILAGNEIDQQKILHLASDFIN